LVHEVIAAIATDPVRIVDGRPSTSTSTGGRPPSTGGAGDDRARRRRRSSTASPTRTTAGPRPGTTRPSLLDDAVAGTGSLAAGRQAPRARREVRAEVVAQAVERHAVLGPARPGDRRLDARQVELEQLVEAGSEPASRHRPWALA
jgi:hypothetical protein